VVATGRASHPLKTITKRPSRGQARGLRWVNVIYGCNEALPPIA